jgi:hypothetical protein
LKVLAGMVEPDNPEAEWQGMPEFDQPEVIRNALCCIVRFKTEDDLRAFEKFLGWKLQHKGKLWSTWYPQTDFDQLGRGKEFVSEPEVPGICDIEGSVGVAVNESGT